MKYHSIEHLVSETFYGMLDKSGLPYAEHSFRVANLAKSFGRTAEEKHSLYVVGLCHDLLEDSSVRASKLAELGVTRTEFEAIMFVTNRFCNGPKLYPYRVFIQRVIAGGFLSTAVKLADVMDNLTREKHEGFKYKEKFEALAVLSLAMREFYQ